MTIDSWFSRTYNIAIIANFVTGRNEVLAKVIFLHLSVILFTGKGGWCLQFFGGSPIFRGGSSKFSGGFLQILGVSKCLGVSNFSGVSKFSGVKISEKLHEIEKILGRGGAACRGRPLNPPLYLQYPSLLTS